MIHIGFVEYCTVAIIDISVSEVLFHFCLEQLFLLGFPASGAGHVPTPTRRPLLVVQLVVEPAGVADRLALAVAAPQAGACGPAVRALGHTVDGQAVALLFYHWMLLLLVS